MSTLRNAEGAISGFFDRIFGRMFRGFVEPVELARKLAREMEDHKTVSVSRVYVPNEYVIYLSDRDHARFHSFESSLTSELATYLAERARHEGFTLLSDPQIRIEVDRDLSVGAYGIACRVVDVPPDMPEQLGGVSDSGGSGGHTTVHEHAVLEDPFGPFIAAAPVIAPADVPEADADVVEPVDDLSEPHDEPGVEPVFDHDGEPQEDEAAEPVAAFDAAFDDVAAEEPAADMFEAEGPQQVEDVPLVAADDAEPPIEAIDPEPEPEPDHAVWPRHVEIPGAPDPIVRPAAQAAVPPADPPPPPARPLPPPGGYEPLAGVSGTQIFQSSDPDEPLLQEEVSLIIGGRRFRLTRRTTTLGRSRDCDIPVQDPNASRQHAEIRHIGLDYFLVDQNSTNGTYVNGQRVRRHALADGDRITIGTTEMIVEHVVMERG